MAAIGRVKTEAEAGRAAAGRQTHGFHDPGANPGESNSLNGGT